MQTRDIALIRINIIKEKNDHYVGKGFDGKKYKILKNEDSRHLKAGDDRYLYVEKLGHTFLYNDVLRALSKSEEYKLSDTNKFSSLAELGKNINNL